jgi:hypothetical protein
MFFISVIIGMSLAACVLLVSLYLRGRSRRNAARAAAVGIEPPDFSGNVLWDVAEGSRRPAIRKGKVCLDRRSFVTRMAAAAMALIGLAAASTVAHGATGDGAGSAEGGHTDKSHYDMAPHTDVTCGPPNCSPSQHDDGSDHADTPHTDQ